jgi:hypothetical protein
MMVETPGSRLHVAAATRRGATAVALGRGGQVRVVEATGRLSTRGLRQGPPPRQTGQLDGMCA